MSISILSIAVVLFLCEVFMIFKHEAIHRHLKKTGLDPQFALFLISVPFFLMILMDIRYEAYSLNRFIPKAYNTSVNYLLGLAGSYGMIQVLGQDSGLKTGILQRDSVQNVFIFSVVALGMAYSVTENRSQSLLATVAYYHLKYLISNNVTAKVCQEEV